MAQNEVKIQIGIFPGKVNDYLVEVGSTVADALKLACLEQGAEQDIKMDGEVVTANTKITANTESVVLAKRIKAACGDNNNDGGRRG